MRDTKFPGFSARSLAAVIITAMAAGATLGLSGCDQQPKQQAAVPAAKPGAKPVDMTKLKWVEMPMPAAQTKFQDAAGNAHTLAEFAGKVVVVNFWATWCGPCIEEMPTLDALQKDMGGDKFAVLAINQDREGLKLAQPFAEKNEWKNLTLYVEPVNDFQVDANLRGLPTTLVVDKQGREVARYEGGANWNAPEMKKVLKELVEKP